MSEKPALTQPKFIKVKDIESARSGYNVYAKVISVDRKEVDTRDGKKIVMVNCVVADESAAANAFFKGDSAHLIEKDNVIAIRNGVKRFVKDHISLEIDLFGRVTLEKNVNIAATSANNISDVEHKLSDKPRRERRDNRDNRDRDRPRRENNRREGEDRPRRNERREPREQREPREPREDRKDREPREPREPKEPREPREQRQPRENQEKKEYVRRDNQERRDPPRDQERRDPPRERKEYNNERRDNGERREYNNNNRRDYGDRRNNDRNLDRPRRDDRDFDRTNNRNEGYNRTENRPRYEEKRGDDTRERRAPLTWTKISSITPGEDSLNLTVRVLHPQLRSFPRSESEPGSDASSVTRPESPTPSSPKASSSTKEKTSCSSALGLRW